MGRGGPALGRSSASAGSCEVSQGRRWRHKQEMARPNSARVRERTEPAGIGRAWVSSPVAQGGCTRLPGVSHHPWVLYRPLCPSVPCLWLPGMVAPTRVYVWQRSALDLSLEEYVFFYLYSPRHVSWSLFCLRLRHASRPSAALSILCPWSADLEIFYRLPLGF